MRLTDINYCKNTKLYSKTSLHIRRHFTYVPVIAMCPCPRPTQDASVQIVHTSRLIALGFIISFCCTIIATTAARQVIILTKTFSTHTHTTRANRKKPTFCFSCESDVTITCVASLISQSAGVCQVNRLIRLLVAPK